MLVVTLSVYWLVNSGLPAWSLGKGPLHWAKAWLPLLNCPTTGPTGWGGQCSLKSARGEGELTLSDAHLLPICSCSGRVGGSD